MTWGSKGWETQNKPFIALILLAFCGTARAENCPNEEPRFQAAFTTSQGVGIGQSCLQPPEGLGDPLTLDEGRTYFEAAFAHLSERMNQCRQRYPELGGYIREWFEQLPQRGIRCNLDSPGIVGVACQDHFKIAPRVRERIIGLEDNLIVGISWISTLAHEIFHYTHVNNRRDHNHVERQRHYSTEAQFDGLRYEDRPISCGANIGIDRVKLVTSLCLQTPLISGLPAEEVLYERIAHCGFESCTNVWNGGYTNYGRGRDQWTLRYPVRDIDTTAATDLCRRIERKGRSDRDRIQLQRQAIQNAIDRSPERINRIRRGFIPFLPRNLEEIRVSSLRLIQTTREWITEQRNGNACLTALFPRTAEGGLRVLAVRGRAPRPKPTPWVHPFVARLRIGNEQTLDRALNSHPACRHRRDDHRAEAQAVGTRLVEALSEILPPPENELLSRLLYLVRGRELLRSWTLGFYFRVVLPVRQLPEGRTPGILRSIVLEEDREWLLSTVEDAHANYYWGLAPMLGPDDLSF